MDASRPELRASPASMQQGESVSAGSGERGVDFRLFFLN